MYEQALLDVVHGQPGSNRQGHDGDQLAACRPTMEPPRTTPVAGSDTILMKPRGSSLMTALAEGRKIRVAKVPFPASAGRCIRKIGAPRQLGAER